jgi:hypothetical protein
MENVNIKRLIHGQEKKIIIIYLESVSEIKKSLWSGPLEFEKMGLLNLKKWASKIRKNGPLKLEKTGL